MENDCVKLDNIMELCGLRIWGFVIYRSVYGSSSDENFANYIKHLQTEVAEAGEKYGDEPTYENLVWTIFEDKDFLENATNDDIKRRFIEWCQSDAAVAEQPDSRHQIKTSHFARYRFCVHINQASLDSFIESTSYSFISRPRDKEPFVNIIAREFPWDIHLNT